MARRILISNAHLKNIGGSELVAVELAEEYAQRGWDVLLCSPQVGEPLRSTIDPRVKVTSKIPDLSENWDIIWDHHGMLIKNLERKPGQLIVTNHMSSYVDIEKPKYDPELPHRIFGNSQETINSMPDEYRVRAQLMQNPAPRWTANIGRGYVPTFISKHRPYELENAGREILDTVFLNGATRVGRDTFTRASFVVANGKSVQYALVCGVPVFLYDQFGGPGWLTEENFEKAAFYNFSGRGFSKNNETLKTLFLHPVARPIPMERVNWRYRLHEWLYFMELV